MATPCLIFVSVATLAWQAVAEDAWFKYWLEIHPERPAYLPGIEIALALSFPCLHIMLRWGIGKREGSPDYSPLSTRVLELREGSSSCQPFASHCFS